VHHFGGWRILHFGIRSNGVFFGSAGTFSYDLHVRRSAAHTYRIRTLPLGQCQTWLPQNNPDGSPGLANNNQHSLEKNSVKNLVLTLFVLSTLTLSLPMRAGTINGNVRLANPSGTSTTPTAGDREPVVLWLQESNTVNTQKTPLIISQRKLQFTPNFLVVPQGQTINFPNDDDVAHNVYVIAGPNQFNFGLYSKGQEKSMVFTQPGLVDMYCSIHPQMHARIFVVTSPYFATILPGHTFSIANVPPGRYTLKVWHERSRLLVKTVTVPATGAVNENITLENVAPQSMTAKD